MNDMPPPNHPFHFLLFPIFIIGASLFGAVVAFHNNNNHKHNYLGHPQHQHQAMTKKGGRSTSSTTTASPTEIGMLNLNIDSSSDCISNDVGTSPNNNNLSSTTLQPIKAGFIGLGTIASSIATALASSSHAPYLSQYASLSLHSIAVTKRSDSKSSKLRQTFPDVVTIYDSAVDVVRNSNEVFLCVLPQQVDEVLAELRKSNVWRKEDHTLVSLVATSNVEDLILQSNLPRKRVYKMICLPSIAKREGCALLQCAPTSAPAIILPPVPTDTNTNINSIDNENNNDNNFVDDTTTDNNNNNNNDIDIKAMLMALGGCVECPNDTIMNTMMITSCMMGPLYGVMRNNRDWLVKHGVTPEDASYFVGRSYLSMVQDAERNCQDNPRRFDDLIEEQTPGGLNEQSLRNLEQQHVFESYDRTMDAILARLQGTSDGSLPSS